MKKELIISYEEEASKIALIEDGRLFEFHTEEQDSEYVVGDLFVGKVKKLAPNLNAAFVNIGSDKDAFLHYQDLGPEFRTYQNLLKGILNKKIQSPSLKSFPIEEEIDKNGMIDKVLSVGDEVLLQITKEPISTKGARVSTQISLTGRYLVLIPFDQKISVSKKIKDSQEKTRLKTLIESIKPEGFGVIIRTVAENKKVAELHNDMNQLIEKWNICFRNIQKNKTLDRAFESNHVAAQIYVTQLDNAPGKLAESVTETMNRRFNTHLEDFCTDAEAEAGMCGKSKLPGGDTNAAILFSPAAPGSLEDKAQLAYIQNILGTPAPKISKEAGQTPAGQDYLIKTAQSDALLSIPAYSLARIKAANTRTNSGLSPNELLEKRTNDYFGGKEALEWSKTLASQSPRGLMVETLKVGGLQTWLDYQSLQQSQRINVNLAALTIAGKQNEQAKTDMAAGVVIGQSVSGGIR